MTRACNAMIQVENVVLPNKPLSNFEIEDAVKKLIRKTFVAFSCETLCQRNQKDMNAVS